jgi:hypothetical protein
VAPQPESAEAAQLVELLGLPVFTPDDDHDEEGPVREGAYQDFPLFETNADGVFCALQGRRLPAKRHPYGMQLRIQELLGDRVTDEGGDRSGCSCQTRAASQPPRTAAMRAAPTADAIKCPG